MVIYYFSSRSTGKEIFGNWGEKCLLLSLYLHIEWELKMFKISRSDLIESCILPKHFFKLDFFVIYIIKFHQSIKSWTFHIQCFHKCYNFLELEITENHAFEVGQKFSVRNFIFSKIRSDSSGYVKESYKHIERFLDSF